MKYLPAIAGVLLGLLFVAASVTFFLNLAPMPPLEPGLPPDHFMKAVGPTGFMHFVKTCELLGGLMVAIPLTRNIGLLFLGPVILNIVAYHAFVAGGEGLFHPMLLAICALALYLLWDARGRFAALLNLRKP